MAIHLKKSYYDKVPSGTVKWITFFDNGRVAKLLPYDGMDKYNKKSIVDSLLLFKEDEINYLEIADKIKEYSNQNDYNIKLNELISINYD